MDLFTHPPIGTVVVCADKLGPVVPRAFPPAAGWSADGRRIKARLDYSRGPEKTWVSCSLLVRDGIAVTMTAPSCSSACYQQFLAKVEAANPGTGNIVVITDNLSSHNSKATRDWLAGHPRIRHAFIPVGACWLTTWCTIRNQGRSG